MPLLATFGGDGHETVATKKTGSHSWAAGRWTYQLNLGLPHKQVHVAPTVTAEGPGRAGVAITLIGTAGAPAFTASPRSAAGRGGSASLGQVGKVIVGVAGHLVFRAMLRGRHRSPRKLRVALEGRQSLFRSHSIHLL